MKHIINTIPIVQVYSFLAILTLDIDYFHKGIRVEVKKGTTIQVDPLRNIALIGLDHVHINDNEYALLS
jgi:hypothetical protein